MKYILTPCDVNYFKLHECLQENKFVEWKQHNYKYEVGDIVFIYISAPESRISYMLEVVQTDIELQNGFDDSAYERENPRTKYQGYKDYTGKLVRFNLIKGLNLESLKLRYLLDNGLKAAPQGPKYLKGELLDYIQYNLIRYTL